MPFSSRRNQFTLKIRGGLEMADKQISKVLPGSVKFGELLAMWGPHHRIVSGLNAAFQQVEELIVLEDDCVPHPTFFKFCEELLERYRDDKRVMHISGSHLQPQTFRSTPYSYTFARWNVSWGWATWRRAWQHFDLEVRLWPQVRETALLTELMKDPRGVKEYSAIFDDLYNRPGQNDGWDYAWSFACWSQSGFTLMPSTTLVANVGLVRTPRIFHRRPTTHGGG